MCASTISRLFLFHWIGSSEAPVATVETKTKTKPHHSFAKEYRNWIGIYIELNWKTKRAREWVREEKANWTEFKRWMDGVWCMEDVVDGSESPFHPSKTKTMTFEWYKHTHTAPNCCNNNIRIMAMDPNPRTDAHSNGEVRLSCSPRARAHTAQTKTLNDFQPRIHVDEMRVFFGMFLALHVLGLELSLSSARLASHPMIM